MLHVFVIMDGSNHLQVETVNNVILFVKHVKLILINVLHVILEHIFSIILVLLHAQPDISLMLLPEHVNNVAGNA